jgi:predicted glycoside hydrolase/deacetylase ChbG (UPF0249 family)
MSQTSVAERLGYPRDARLLLVTGDDVGFTHSANRASEMAMKHGFVTSGSVMVPCPWFQEIADLARREPGIDLGVHLTLTCECATFKWGPTLGAPRVPSLVDGHGTFPVTEAEVLERANADEVEAELRNQIERAIEGGLRPTHLDSHMGVLFGRRDLFAVYRRLAKEYRMPIRNPRTWWFTEPFLIDDATPDDLLLDLVISPGEQVASGTWSAFYSEAVANVRPGVTEVVFHLGLDDEELRAAYVGMEGWGPAWRQRDLDVALEPGWPQRIAAAGAVLIGWRDLQRLIL